jgi:hypothetical protein
MALAESACRSSRRSCSSRIPATTNGGVTSDTVIDLKNAHKAWIVVELTHAVGFAEVISLRQATDVASAPMQGRPDRRRSGRTRTPSATDTLVKQTAAASFHDRRRRRSTCRS